MTQKINLVRQQHSDGCGAACLAMLLGYSYEEARPILPGYTTYTAMLEALELYLPTTNLNYSNFALLMVGNEKQRHWILAYNGKIYDPAYSNPTKRMNKKYEEVFRVIGTGWR